MDKLLKKAVQKHRAGDFVAAEALYKKILRQAPQHVDGNYMLGTLYAEHGRLAQALQVLQRAAALKADSPYIHNNLGNIHRLQHNYELAAECYRRALRLQPDLVPALNNLGVVLKAQGDATAAEQMFRQALQHDRTFVDASYNLGNVYWDRDLREEAVVHYREVLAMQPCHGHALDRLGDYWLGVGDREQALACFRKYMQCTAVDDCGVALKLAYLGEGDLPLRQPGRLVVDTYAQKAATWDRDVNRPEMRYLGPQNVNDYLRETTAENRAGLGVLDLGCGSGLCAEFLRPLAARLVGVDISAAMLQAARSKNLYDNLVCDDLEHYLGVCEQRFDLVVAAGVMIFFGELRPLLSSLSSLLQPGGRLLFTVYRGDEADIQVRSNYHFAHSAAYLRAAAQQAALTVEALRDVVHEYEQDAAQAGYLVCLRRDSAVA